MISPRVCVTYPSFRTASLSLPPSTFLCSRVRSSKRTCKSKRKKKVNPPTRRGRKKRVREQVREKGRRATLHMGESPQSRDGVEVKRKVVAKMGKGWGNEMRPKPARSKTEREETKNQGRFHFTSFPTAWPWRSAPGIAWRACSRNARKGEGGQPTGQERTWSKGEFDEPCSPQWSYPPSTN
jgi:hypothetical protein